MVPSSRANLKLSSLYKKCLIYTELLVFWMQFSENKYINVDIFDCHLDVLPECIDDEYPHEAFQVSLVPVPHHTLVGLILLHQGPNHSAQVLSTQALYKTVKYLLNLLAFSFYLSSFVCFYFLPFLQVIITHLANNKN